MVSLPAVRVFMESLVHDADPLAPDEVEALDAVSVGDPHAVRPTERTAVAPRTVRRRKDMTTPQRTRGGASTPSPAI
jgi:hypothetical protein